MAVKKCKIQNFDIDADARKNLLLIIEEEARFLYPHEVAWILGISIATAYEFVPRVTHIKSFVRFDPKVIKELRNQNNSKAEVLDSSLKFKKKAKSVDVSKHKKSERKILCL